MQPHYDTETRLNVKVPMGDGVNLSADIYLPKAHGKFPTVLMRTPYSNTMTTTTQKTTRTATHAHAAVHRNETCRFSMGPNHGPGGKYPLPWPTFLLGAL
mgnify:CR=1 FL=1